MLKKILVPLGDSPDTRQALTNACIFGSTFGSEIQGLFVTDEEKLRAEYVSSFQMSNPLGGMELSAHYDNLELIQEDLKKEEENAVRMFDEFKTRCTSLKAGIEKISGVIWEEILRVSKDFDLIVMGKTMFDEELDLTEEARELGDIFQRVLRNTNRPVLACTRDHSVGQKLMACYDGKKNSMKALGTATAVARHFKAPLAVLTINPDKSKAEVINREGINIAIENGVTDVVPILREGNTVESILEEIKRLEINFLFMGAYGDSPIKDFFVGSTTDAVLKKSSCPVFLYR